MNSLDKLVNSPVISVAIPVYNHESFVARALDSVLKQETEFAYDIIVGDDFSSDNTRQILLGYKEKYPEKIKLLLAEKNMGVIKNAFEIYRHCRGKYIAMIEGDDEWICKHKLQAQVSFLEQNPEFVGSFHDALIISDKKQGHLHQNQLHSEFKYYSQFNKFHQVFTSIDIIERNIIPTASFVFRNDKSVDDFLKMFSDIKLSLIWAFQIYVIGKGKVIYFNEPWSIYNDHSAGISKRVALNDFKYSNIKILKRFAKDKNYNRNSIYKTIVNEFLQILMNPHTYKEKKSVFYKNLLLFIWHKMVALRFELLNIYQYKNNQRKY